MQQGAYLSGQLNLAFNVDLTTRKAIKSQGLVDFVAEWTEIQQPMPDAILDHWKMYFDGSLKLGGASVGVLFSSPDRKQLKYVLQILWQAMNNEAEYKALIHGLRGSYLPQNQATSSLR
jgi:hypothetical protein